MQIFFSFVKWASLGYLIYNEVKGDKVGANLFASFGLENENGQSYSEQEAFKQYYKTQKFFFTNIKQQ